MGSLTKAGSGDYNLRPSVQHIQRKIMKKIAVRMLLLSLVVIIAATPAFAGKKKGASTEPGKYEEWQDEIDEMEIIQAFAIGDYDALVVVPFDTDDVELPEKDDNTYEPVKKV